MHLDVIHYEDWAALYVNGVRMYEDHQIVFSDLIRAAKGEPFTLALVPYDVAERHYDGIVQETGSWPETMDEVNAPEFLTTTI